MKKRLFQLVMAVLVFICFTFTGKGIVAKAAMEDEAEEYEMETEYKGSIDGYEERYFSFYISEKSYVSLVTTWKNNSNKGVSEREFKIYSSEGIEVLRSEDIYYSYNEVSEVNSGTAGRILAEGIYYLQVGTGSTGSYGDFNFSFRIQAEKQIKLPKGVISSLKSNKSGQITVSITSATDAIGYRIQYSTDYKFKSGVKTVRTDGTTKTISGLKKGKKYYVKVCPYTVYDDGESVYGQNSLVKAVKVKK